MMESREIKTPRPRHLHLGKRQLRVLRKIARVGLASFDFLRKDALLDCSHGHAQDVLRELVQEGYLVVSHCDCGSILGWRINRDSVRALRATLKIDPVTSTVPHYRTSFRHHQLLNEFMELYLSSPAVSGWVVESELKSKLAPSIHRLSTKDYAEKLLGVPDGLLLLKRGDREVKIAFELELTQKSAKRIKKKLESYITSNSFDFAFFVLDGSHLKEHFIALYRDIINTSINIKLSIRRNGIYFAELSDVQKDGLQAKFSSLKNVIAIADFHELKS